MGPFKNFSWPSADVRDFNEKINVILGWNGTGKTIISRILRSFELEEIHKKIDGAEFSVEFNDASVKSNRDLTGLKNKIRVFNEDYIEKVLSQGHLDYVIAIGEAEVDFSKKEIEKEMLWKQLEKVVCKNEHGDIAKYVALSVIKPIAGIGGIKKELERSGRYDAYTSSSFVKRIQWITKEIKEGKTIDDFIKTEDRITLLREQLKNQGRKQEEYKKLKKWHDWIFSVDEKGLTQLKRINNILAFIPKYEPSDRISQYPDWSEEGEWIRKGVDLHRLKDQENSLDTCLFCNSQIKNKEELLKHFSDDLVKLTNALDNLEYNTTKALEEIEACKSFYKDEKEKLLAFFNELKNKIVIKKKNKLQEVEPMKFDKLFIEDEVDDDLSSIAWEIETHYVAQKYDLYIEKENAFIECKKQKEKLQKQLQIVTDELKKLKEKAKNVHAPKENLNNLLKVVFPYKNIELSDSEDGVGYILSRNGRKCNLVDLSEGERNFLALAYFLISINTKEEGKQLDEEGIVVIDDPVSSLDSDSLFHIYSILLGEIETSPDRQYFILTHNLDFFGHLLKRFKRDGEELDNFYQIALKSSGSIISRLHDKLSNYNSDYRYAIAKLNEIKNSNDINDKIFAANLLRRVLETFLHFKYGQGSLSVKIDQIYNIYKARVVDSIPEQYREQKEKEITSEKELLYRFINYGSHEFLGIEKIDMSALNHGKDVINRFFKLVRVVDPEHYRSFKF